MTASPIEAITRRSLRTYAACIPEKVSGGSKAQMVNFVADAKADIALLAASLAAAQAEVERVRTDAARFALEMGRESGRLLGEKVKIEEERDRLRAELEEVAAPTCECCAGLGLQADGETSCPCTLETTPAPASVITEEMVERALKGWYGPGYNPNKFPPETREYHKSKARTALAAALEARDAG